MFRFIVNMRIHPRLTKFSSAYTKGSLAQRFAFADKINEKIFGNTVKLYRGKRRNYPAEIIEECYNFCTPENKNILFEPVNFPHADKYTGCTEIIEKMGMYAGFVIELPFVGNRNINIKLLPTFMHESTHVLDFMLNPKFLKNDLDMTNSSLRTECVDFYEKFFYKFIGNTPELTLETAYNETVKFLKKIPDYMKITFLNYMRYNMQMEMHAYSQDTHYARILKKLGKPVGKGELEDYNKTILYSEKIKIVEKLLAQTIKKEREKLKPLTISERMKSTFAFKSPPNE